MTLDLRRSVMETVRLDGSGSAWGIARSLGVQRQEVVQALDELLLTGRVRAIGINGRPRYFFATREFTECQCEGTCIGQLIALSGRLARATYEIIAKHGSISMIDLFDIAGTSEPGTERSLRHCIGKLLESGLVSAIPEQNDPSQTVYIAQPRHPVVQSVFGPLVMTDG